MATQFSIVLEAPKSDAGRVHAVAEEVFFEIRRLESFLSRFIEDSEISQINRLAKGKSIIVSPETFRCLELAQDAKQMTRGHFDVAWLSEGVPHGQEAYVLHSRPFRVMSLTESLHIDLGGIGKGFALEHVCEIPSRYGYPKALLCADTSTILALEPPHNAKGWPVQLEMNGRIETLELAHEALSCSGKTVRGEHVFDPRQRKYTTLWDRVYVRKSSPALADALSTAIMTMPDNGFDLFPFVWSWE